MASIHSVVSESLVEAFRPDHTAVLVHDMQHDFCSPGGTIFDRAAKHPETIAAVLLEGLTGTNGIYELVFESKNIQYRPLGFYGPGEKEFTFLVGATKKGSKRKIQWQPRTAIQIATRLRPIVITDRSRSREFSYAPPTTH